MALLGRRTTNAAMKMLASIPAVRYLKECLVKFQCTCLIGPGISWTGNCPQQLYLPVNIIMMLTVVFAVTAIIFTTTQA